MCRSGRGAITGCVENFRRPGGTFLILFTVIILVLMALQIVIGGSIGVKVLALAGITVMFGVGSMLGRTLSRR